MPEPEQTRTDHVYLELPWPPALNRMYRTYQGRVLLSAEGRAYKERVGWLCLAALRTEDFAVPLRGDVSLTLFLYRPAKRGDIDGYQKALMDAIQGHVYENDSQVTELHVYRYDDKANPRVTLLARPAITSSAAVRNADGASPLRRQGLVSS